jgi:hypothetical protein
MSARRATTLPEPPLRPGLVAERLRAFGCDEVVTGLGKTGVVGVIRGRSGGGARP